MIPSWLIIGLTAVVIAIVFNRLFPSDIKWFNRQKRPKWLTFEGLIPLIWTVIFICGAWSAYAIWESEASHGLRIILAMSYGILEILILAYTPVMTRMKSLVVGTVVGLAGWLWGLGLTIAVAPVSLTAMVLLIPFLVWSAIGAFITWEMAKLNRFNIR